MGRGYPNICAAKRCFNSRITHPNKEFFSFPSDVSICKTWLENCERTDLEVGAVSRSHGFYKICADHFEDHWFIDKAKTYLNKHINPVPTIFSSNAVDFVPSGLPTNSSNQEIDLTSEPGADSCVSGSHCEDVLELQVNSASLPSYHSQQLFRKDDCNPLLLSEAFLLLNPDTELFKIDDMCRFCMSAVTDDYVHIFSDSAEAHEIRHMCDIVIPKKIDVSDRLPQKICRSCIADLKICRRVLEKFKYAENYLRSIAKYSIFVEDEDESDDEEDSSLTYTDFFKSVSNKAMVVPLDIIKGVLEIPEDYPEETNTTKENTSMLPDDVAMDVDINDTEVSHNEVIEVGQTIKEENIELVCSNVLILPTEYQEAQNSSDCKQPCDEILQHDSVLSLPQLEEGKVNTQCNRVENIECMEDSGIENVRSSLSYTINEEVIEGVDIKKEQELSSTTQDDATEGTIQNANLKPEESASSKIISYRCVECSEIFNTYPELVEHVSNEHSVSSMTCTICCKKFKNIRSLVIHRKTEHPNHQIKCPKCDPSEESFKNRAELNNHLKEVHGFKCSHCHMIFYSQDKLDKHLIASHDNKTDCSICGKQLKNGLNRRLHEMTHDPNCLQVCWICGATLKTKSSFQQHMKIHDDQTFACDVCHRTFSTVYLMLRHKRVHTSEYHEKLFLCQYCPRRFSYKAALVQHLYTHTANKPHKCEFCGRGFNRKRNVVQHQRRRKILGVCPTRGTRTDIEDTEIIKERREKRKMQKEKKELEMNTVYECEICQRKFIRRFNYQKHRRYHDCNGDPEVLQKLLNEPEEHECDVCGMILMSKMALQYHMRKHTGSKRPFQCDFCERSFATHTTARAHERYHSGDKPYKCRYCDKTFRETKPWRAHESEHSAGPQTCQICNKTFKRRALLLKHTFIHKDAFPTIRPYQCTECGRGFISNLQLQQHMKVAHFVKDEEEDATTFPCPECPRVYTNKESRRHHIRNIHKAKSVKKKRVQDEPSTTIQCLYSIKENKKKCEEESQTTVQYASVVEEGQENCNVKPESTVQYVSVVEEDQENCEDSQTTVQYVSVVEEDQENCEDSQTTVQYLSVVEEDQENCEVKPETTVQYVSVVEEDQENCEDSQTTVQYLSVVEEDHENCKVETETTVQYVSVVEEDQGNCEEESQTTVQYVKVVKEEQENCEEAQTAVEYMGVVEEHGENDEDAQTTVQYMSIVEDDQENCEEGPEAAVQYMSVVEEYEPQTEVISVEYLSVGQEIIEDGYEEETMTEVEYSSFDKNVKEVGEEQAETKVQYFGIVNENEEDSTEKSQNKVRYVRVVEDKDVYQIPDLACIITPVEYSL